jgi:uncharacterized protein YcfJ
MKRILMIALVTAGLGTTAAVTAGALLDGADPTPDQIRVVHVNPLQTTIVPQPANYRLDAPALRGSAARQGDRN